LLELPFDGRKRDIDLVVARLLCADLEHGPIRQERRGDQRRFHRHAPFASQATIGASPLPYVNFALNVQSTGR